MTERAFVSPGERILARLRPIVARLPDAAKVAALPLLVFWIVNEGLNAGMGWAYRDLLDIVEPSGLQRAVIAVIWVVPAAIRVLLASMLVIGWLRVLTGLETAGWFSGLSMNRRVLRAWALLLVMGTARLLIEQPLYLLDLVEVGGAGPHLLTMAANLPGIQGLVFVLMPLLAWAPVLPLALGFVPIARGESFVLRDILVHLRGCWWRTAGMLVALLALVWLVAWLVSERFPAAFDERWLRDAAREVFMLWDIAALMVVAAGAAVLERRLPRAPRTVLP